MLNAHYNNIATSNSSWNMPKLHRPVLFIANILYSSYLSRINFCRVSSEILRAPSSTWTLLSVVSVVSPKTQPRMHLTIPIYFQLIYKIRK
jgi:hypothetical protein